MSTRAGAPLRRYYRVERGDGRGVRLVEVPPNTRGLPMEHPWPEGAQVEVRIQVHAAPGGLFVSGVEIITKPEPINLPEFGITITAPEVEPLPVGSDVMRAIPLGQLTDAAIRAVATDTPMERDLSDDQRHQISRALTATRRGPKSRLSPRLLQLVADAYRQGGHSAVRAVQRALDADPEFEGSGPEGEVTRAQASRAVVTARRDGYLPPARG